MEEGKNCSKCGEFKSFDCFVKQSKSKDGKSGVCKQCDKEYKAAYYLKNKERIRAEQQEYRDNHKEEIKARDKRYLEKNRDKLLAYKREYYKKNFERAKENSEKWRAENPEKVRAYARAGLKRNKFKWAARCASRRAKKLQATP